MNIMQQVDRIKYKRILSELNWFIKKIASITSEYFKVTFVITNIYLGIQGKEEQPYSSIDEEL